MAETSSRVIALKLLEHGKRRVEHTHASQVRGGIFLPDQGCVLRLASNLLLDDATFLHEPISRLDLSRQPSLSIAHADLGSLPEGLGSRMLSKDCREVLDEWSTAAEPFNDDSAEAKQLKEDFRGKQEQLSSNLGAEWFRSLLLR